MQINTYKPWTQSDIMFLLLHIDEPISSLAFAMSRSEGSVRVMRHRLAQRYRSCDEDCEHCRYADCVRPVESF